MKLIDDWRRHLWRAWSIRLAWLAGIAAGFLTQYPTALPQLVGYVPEHWRPAAAFGVAVITFGVPALARLVKQGGGNGTS